MKPESAWQRWAMGTARSWRDIQGLLRETGIDMVDADHRVLLEYAVKINLLAEDVGAGFSEELLDRQRELLQALQDYTIFHFEREEQFIQAVGAPNLELQKSEHARIIRSLEERSGDFKSGRVTVSPDLRRSIFLWIIDHISGTDYETFRLANLEKAFASARSWQEVRRILRATGVDALDHQHRLIVTAILRLSAALRDDADGPTLQGKISRLIKLTEYHFTEEQAFMEKFSIAGVAEQAATHAEFLQRLGEIENAGNTMEFLPPKKKESFVHELMTWLVTHVNGMDYRDLRKSDWLPMAFETFPHEDLQPLIRSTGIQLVDSQHREFVERASAFGDHVAACQKGGSANVMLSSFDGLISYAEKHFKDEEVFFPEASTTRAYRHLEEHGSILKTLKDYRWRLSEGRIGAAAAIRSIIIGLWVTHTNGTDIDTLGSAVFDREIEDDA